MNVDYSAYEGRRSVAGHSSTVLSRGDVIIERRHMTGTGYWAGHVVSIVEPVPTGQYLR